MMRAKEIVSLDQLRWEKRLIVGNISDTKRAEDFMTDIREKMDPIDERKLTVLILVRKGNENRWMIHHSGESFAPTKKIEQEVIARLNGAPLALVGLDGGIKSRYTLDGFCWQAVFDQIDAMPMRIREMRHQAEN